jgi:ABC-type multidrug transport system fused ATPase/permease subunit
MVRDHVLSSVLDALFNNVTDIGTALLLVLAALSISSGQLRPGDLALFIIYLSLVTDFFNAIGQLLVQQKQTRVSFGRLVALIQGIRAERWQASQPREAGEHLVAHHDLYLHMSTLPSLDVAGTPQVPGGVPVDDGKSGCDRRTAGYLWSACYSRSTKI